MTDIEFTHEQDVELINFMGGDDNVAMSAWVSFGNDKEERLGDRAKVAGLIRFLYREGHMTPFESSVFTFRVETPIFVAREFFRHRSASYNEMSGRYTVMPKKFYVPEEGVRPLQQAGKPGNYHFVPGTYAQGREVDGSIRRTVAHCVGAYDKMLDAGVAKEVARMVLPVNIYTEFYVTMNARNLMHFLTLRTDSTALYEIRQVAAAMEEHLKQKMPLTYEAFKAKQASQEAKSEAPKPVTQPSSITIASQRGQEYQIWNAPQVDIKVDPVKSGDFDKAVKDAIDRLERKRPMTFDDKSERQRELTQEATKPNLEEPLVGVFFPRDPSQAYQEFTHVSPEQKMYKAYRDDLNVLRDRVKAGLKNALDAE